MTGTLRIKSNKQIGRSKCSEILLQYHSHSSCVYFDPSPAEPMLTTFRKSADPDQLASKEAICRVDNKTLLKNYPACKELIKKAGQGLSAILHENILYISYTVIPSYTLILSTCVKQK